MAENLIGGEDVLDLGVRSHASRRSSCCLVRRLCTDKAVNLFALTDVMIKSFKASGKITAREWGKGMTIFCFEREDDTDWVLRNQPWHFEGFLFAIRKLIGTEQPSTFTISYASFWVRAYDLPIDCQTDDVVKIYGGGENRESGML